MGEAAEIATSTLAEIYAQQGLHARALAIYRKLARRTPQDEEVAARVAELSYEIERRRIGEERAAARTEHEIPIPADGRSSAEGALEGGAEGSERSSSEEALDPDLAAMRGELSLPAADTPGEAALEGPLDAPASMSAREASQTDAYRVELPEDWNARFGAWLDRH